MTSVCAVMRKHFCARSIFQTYCIVAFSILVQALSVGGILKRHGCGTLNAAKMRDSTRYRAGGVHLLRSVAKMTELRDPTHEEHIAKLGLDVHDGWLQWGGGRKSNPPFLYSATYLLSRRVWITTKNIPSHGLERGLSVPMRGVEHPTFSLRIGNIWVFRVFIDVDLHSL